MLGLLSYNLSSIKKLIVNYSCKGYHCSAGIANNKTLAKLCCGINKPNKQTILPLCAHQELMEKTPIQKV